MSLPQSMDELRAQNLLRSVQAEQQASNALFGSGPSASPWWEVPFAVLLGSSVAGIAYASGQQVLSAATAGIAIASLNVAVACAGQTRRLNRRLNAVLQLYEAREGIAQHIAPK